MRRSTFPALAMLLVRCHAANDERTADTAPAPTSEARPTERPAAAAPEASEATVPPCAPALRVSARVVATEWPSRLGQRVLLRVRAVRALGLGESLVVSEGTRFVVLSSPEARLDGVHTFVITGSATLALAGRVRLPELLLDDSCAS